jgi:sigma-B regulation protein RsbU (phosphoserine phosphatase)
LASNLQASIRALGGTHTSPGAILTAVNRSLHESTDDDRFATTFLASLRPDGLVYSNGGHNPPLVRRACGSIEWLQVGATPLGAFPGIEYPEAIIDLEPGDLVVLFTDGVTEAPDPQEEFFGESGLLKIVQECSEWRLDDLLTRLREAVFAHCHGKASDDMTVVLLRRRRETPILTPA